MVFYGVDVGLDRGVAITGLQTSSGRVARRGRNHRAPWARVRCLASIHQMTGLADIPSALRGWEKSH